MRLHTPLKLRKALMAGLTLALAGCAVGPTFHRPEAPKATRYTPQISADTTAASPVPGGEAQHWVASMDITGQWWMRFRSGALDALVDDALRRNPDVAAAQAALRAAWENVYAQRGAYFPEVDGSANTTRQNVAKDLASPAASGNGLFNLTTAQVSVTYAPDLWGGTRRQVEALMATANEQRFELEATYLTLTTNLVNGAIGEASLRAQIQATQSMIQAQTRMLFILQRQQALGDVPEAAVAAQVAVLEQSRAALPPLQKQLAQQRDLLAALSGRTPDEDMAAQFTLDSLHLPTDLPLSLPAQLVEQRPDVRAAEEQLHAASAEVGVAIANRLPNLQIDGNFGRASEKAGALFKAGNGFWSLGATLTQPLFDGGSLKHKQRAVQAAYAQAAAQYRSVVIGAMQNVADTLHAIQSDADAMVAANRAERAAARSVQIAQRQLALGDISESTMLATELAWQQTTLALVQAQAARYADTVALFQALGGGWWHRKDAPPIELSSP